MVEPKNYRIKSFVRERDFLANNFKNSYGYYLLDKPLYKEEIILHLSVDKEDNFVSINVNYANGTVFAPFYNPDDKICENHPNTDVIKINWNNVEQEIYKIGLHLPFGITKRRKGLQLFFWDDLFTNVKQWKEELNIEIKTTWTEYKPTINELLNFRDGDKAIQYLVERGLNSNSVMKELQ